MAKENNANKVIQYLSVKQQREQLGKEEDAREMEELPSMFMLNSMKNFLSGCSSVCS